MGAGAPSGLWGHRGLPGFSPGGTCRVDYVRVTFKVVVAALIKGFLVGASSDRRS
jgi:hypothetical protein